MFKNREIRIRVAKTSEQPTETGEQKPFMTKDEAHAIATDMIKRTAITVVAVMACSVALHTASEILINALETNDKDED